MTRNLLNGWRLRQCGNCAAKITWMNADASEINTFQLVLKKPLIPWGPKPTVVVDSLAQPTQWGTRSWKVKGSEARSVSIFLFNRFWKYGQVEFDVLPGSGASFEYKAPLLPFLKGKIRES